MPLGMSEKQNVRLLKMPPQLSRLTVLDIFENEVDKYLKIVRNYSCVDVGVSVDDPIKQNRGIKTPL